MNGRWTKTKGWNRWDDQFPDVDEGASVIVATSDENTGEAHYSGGYWIWENDNPIVGDEVLFWRDLPEAPEWTEECELETLSRVRRQAMASERWREENA